MYISMRGRSIACPVSTWRKALSRIGIDSLTVRILRMTSLWAKIIRTFHAVCRVVSPKQPSSHTQRRFTRTNSSQPKSLPQPGLVAGDDGLAEFPFDPLDHFQRAQIAA